MAQAKVIDYRKQAEYYKGKSVHSESVEQIKILFQKFKSLREVVKDCVDNFPRPRGYKKNRGHYDRSVFYIGKSITRLSFLNCYVNYHQMRHLMDSIQNSYNTKGCSFVIQGRDIHCYFRGERKSR